MASLPPVFCPFAFVHVGDAYEWWRKSVIYRAAKSGVIS